MAGRKLLRCRECGGRAGPGNDIYCGDGCRRAVRGKQAAAALALAAAGFTQHAQAANLWVKDGRAVSVEEAAGHGIEATLAKHRRR
jgi:hypothetical protein